MGTERLAIDGGVPVKTTPFGTGRRFGEDELGELRDALEQDTLFYHFGTKVKAFLHDFNRMYDRKYSVAASSGTAAVHVALGAAGIGVGDEVITSPITDMGTVIGILYQNAIPVFADVEPHTYNMDAASVASCITSRTKAIVVVHLAGNPCDMDGIMALARRRGLIVIEDCAQSYLAKYKGRLTGTIGDYGCFSTNDFKHISTGEGGIVTVNSNETNDYLKAHAFADKNYSRLDGAVARNSGLLAPNYRMTELQGAVGIAQLKKLPWICRRRREIGERITDGISGLESVFPHEVRRTDECTFWFYMLRVDTAAWSREEFSRTLAAEGIPNQPGYIPEPLTMMPVFRQRQAYEGSRFPFDLSDAAYGAGVCPTAERVLQTAVRIPISEFYSDEDTGQIVAAIRKTARGLNARKSLRM